MSLAQCSISVWCDETSNPRNQSFDELNGGEHRSGRADRLKVLVVDDESTIADTLVEILNGEGFEAVAASTGDDALELVREFKPDVVISDVIMPGANGVDIGIQIRDILPKCRIILFSGQSATVNLLREAQKQGHEFEIVAKPIKPQVLISMIRRRSGH